MKRQVQLSISTYKHLIAKLKDSQLDDVAEHLQRNIIDGNCNNEEERSETPTTENSDCNSLETSNDDSSRFAIAF